MTRRSRNGRSSSSGSQLVHTALVTMLRELPSSKVSVLPIVSFAACRQRARKREISASESAPHAATLIVSSGASSTGIEEPTMTPLRPLTCTVSTIGDSDV